MNYAESIAWLESLPSEMSITKNAMGLTRVNQLLGLLGNPHQKIKTVHVAGTSGKGSTSHFTASILHAGGYKTGLYTSPHLQKINERIALNRKNISDAAFARVATKVKHQILKRQWTNGAPSYFETVAAMAFLYFQQEKVDIAVIEVGLGGTKDATNVIIPLVSVITSISMDHVQILGPTLKEIAQNKAGIIKKNVPVVVGGVPKIALKVIQKKARKEKAPIIFSKKAKQLKMNFNQLTFTAPFRNNLIQIKTPSVGTFQLENAGLAIKAIEVLVEKGWKINEKAILNGFKKTKVPSRFEVMQSHPLIILDGAHNTEKTEALVNTLSHLKKKADFLVGILQKKEAQKMVKSMSSVARQFTFIEPQIKKSYWDVEKLVKMGKRNKVTSNSIKGSKESLFDFIQNYHGKFLVITGSLYLTGTARHYWFPTSPLTQKEKNEIIIIAAIAQNGVIGKDNALPWHDSHEFTHFKKATVWSTLVMGRKTFDSLGKPLPNRNNIVISKTLRKRKGVVVCRSVEEALEKARSYGKKIFVIGGAEIFSQTIPLADKMYLSFMKGQYTGDTFFPAYNKKEWKIVKREKNPSFEFRVYERIK